MDLNQISLLSSINQKMKWLAARQKVLAQNIANANTPGYTPKDLKKVSFKAHLDQTDTGAGGGMQLQKTDARHMSSGGALAGKIDISEEESIFYSTSPDGNAVALEDELLKMTETQMDYTMATNLYKKHVGMMRTALGKK